MKKIFQNKKVVSLLIIVCLVIGGLFTYNNLKSNQKAQRAIEKYFSQLKKDKIPKDLNFQDFSDLQKVKIIDFNCTNVTNYGNSTERQLFYNFIVEDNLQGRKPMKIIAVADKKDFLNYEIVMIGEDTR